MKREYDIKKMKLNPNPYVSGKKSKAATKKASKKIEFDKKIKEYKKFFKRRRRLGLALYPQIVDV